MAPRKGVKKRSKKKIAAKGKKKVK